jgi:hypothetical protein
VTVSPTSEARPPKVFSANPGSMGHHDDIFSALGWLDQSRLGLRPGQVTHWWRVRGKNHPSDTTAGVCDGLEAALRSVALLGTAQDSSTASYRPILHG